MKQMVRYVYIFLFLIVMVPFINSQRVEFGVGINLTPSTQTEETKEEKKKTEEKKKKDEFISKIAVKFEYDDAKLQELSKEGFGRLELIKLILISTYTATNFDEVIKLRKSGKKLSNIAKKYNLDYKEIYTEARRIKKELEEE